MSPILQAALGSIIRHFLTMAAAVLVTRGIWTSDEAVNYVSAAALAILGLGWSLYQKYRTDAVIEKALRLPSGSSREELK
jgi:predicted transcriptional regulator